MSSQRGNVTKPAQKNQNDFAFRHNKGSKLSEYIEKLPIRDVCKKCCEVIEWRKKFRKYKPLTVAKKCVKCEQKTVKSAYHIICLPCASSIHVCAKCGEEKSDIIQNDELSHDEEQKIKQELKFLSERERRKYWRENDT
eukprot:Sdes_comp17279_c0_seq1m6476